MKLDITKFMGVSPLVGARFLSPNHAQTATNVDIRGSSLDSLMGVSDIAAFSKSGTIQSIYRFGQDISSDTQYWLHWTDDDIDVVKGFVAGDTTERTFFTGDGVPKATDSTLALTGGGSSYPIAAYMLGLPAPVTAPTCVVSGTAQSGSTPETRVYTYTWVNSWGEESAPYIADPMPSSTTVDVSTGQTVNVTLPVPDAGNYNITHKRIYRSTAGTYLFVAQVTAATTLYNDAVDAEDVSDEMASLTWDAPPAALAGLVGMPGGVLAGFTGNDVYFSEPYFPFAWPESYIQTIGYKPVGSGVIDTTLVVLTQGKPYFIQGSHPDSMTVVEADVSQACVAKRSIVSMNGSVIYASPDGLVSLAPGGSKILTENIFTRAQWQALLPSSIHAYEYERKYIGFYNTGAASGGFIYDTATGEFSFNSVYAAGGYSDLKNDTLYVIVSNRLKKWEAGTALTYTWKSKLFTLPVAKSFSCYQVSAETYPVTMTIYRDGTAIVSKSVTSDAVGRIPSGYGTDWEIELSGAVEVYRVVLAESPSEISDG